MAISAVSRFLAELGRLSPIVSMCVLIALLVLLKSCCNDSRNSRRDSGTEEPNRVHLGGENSPTTGRPMGLEAQTMDALPIVVYKRPGSFNEGFDCAVCLCEFQETEKIKLLPECNHSFHRDCIDMWFYSHSTCPLCRIKVKWSISAEESSSDREEEISSSNEGIEASFVNGHHRIGETSSVGEENHNTVNIIMWVEENHMDERTSQHEGIDNTPS